MDGPGSFMHHDINMGAPNSQLPPVHAVGMAAAADPAVQALLERMNQLENYKVHLENENKQMHQQLQVLSGFLNVVSTSVRTTENMLFSSVAANEPPHMQIQAEGSQMLSAVPSQSTVTAVAAGPAQAQTPTPTGMQQQQQQQRQQQVQQPPMLGSNGHPSNTHVYSASPTAAAAAAAGQANAQQLQHQLQQQQQQAAAAAAVNEANQSPAAAAAANSGPAADGGSIGATAPAAAAAAAIAAAANKDIINGATAGTRRRSSQAELAVMDGSTAAAAAVGGGPGSRKRARTEPSPSPSLPMTAAAANSSAALAAAVAAASNYMPTPQQQQQLAQMQQMQQFMPLGLGGSEITLRLTKVQGKTVLHSDPVMIYRVELSRNGVFEKYLFLPNDAIPIYGMRTWQHRDAIPQELLKMVENCLTTKAVASEQYIEEIKTMKAYMLQQCPHLARWGLGSNKVRLVTDSGMRDLVNRLHRTMQKHGTVVLPKQLEVDLGWITSPDLLQLPVQAWTAPVYSRRLQNVNDDPYAAAGLAAPYGISIVAAAAAGSNSGMGPTDNSPSASGMGGDMFHQQQMVTCGLPNMMPVMMPGGQQQQQNGNQMYYSAQQDMTMQQLNMMPQQGLLPRLQQQQQQLQQSTALGGPNISTGITLTNIAHQGSTAADQGLLGNGYAPVTPCALGPGALDSLNHGQGSRSDLQGQLLHHGSSSASEAAASLDGVVPPAALDTAALASMPVVADQQKDAEQGPAVADPKPQQQQQPSLQHRQNAAAVPPVKQQRQQPAQQSPGAAGSNGSTDSTMADAVAGLQALSRQQEESLLARRNQQQQQQQCGTGKAATDLQPVRDQKQQRQQQPGPQAVQQQQDATGSRQGSAPSPDATAICAAAPAAATAIAVQQ